MNLGEEFIPRRNDLFGGFLGQARGDIPFAVVQVNKTIGAGPEHEPMTQVVVMFRYHRDRAVYHGD